jgi:catalase
VFTRISTVAGGAGSVDTPRDVRGFAVKFYTPEGNWDLVGNNIPVFFIQDAIKFPDLVHAVKMEPDRGFPQAATAHDTFWDFISLTPESMHMVMWIMSDRTLPRSLRMIEGFGVHSFRLINAAGESTFVKFHWRPKLGLQSTVWDEAVKLPAADPTTSTGATCSRPSRRAISPSGSSPCSSSPRRRRTLSVRPPGPDQAHPRGAGAAEGDRPHGAGPLARQLLRRDRAGGLLPGQRACRASTSRNDPLLQGRLFSYLDTQLSRLGSPNFARSRSTRPSARSPTNQRDGHMQMQVPKGRVNYEPSSFGRLAARAPAQGLPQRPGH